MAPTIEQLEQATGTMVEQGDLILSMWASHHEVMEVDLTVDNGWLASRLGIQTSPSVKLRSLSINGPEQNEWITAKSGPKASQNFTSIIKTADRTDPWVPKKTEE